MIVKFLYMVIMLATTLLVSSSPILAQVRVVKLPPTVKVNIDTTASALHQQPSLEQEVKDASQVAILKFDKTTVNFGTFYENEVQTATFTFRNIGGAPLEIRQAFASCGCTVPHFEKKKIAPGEMGVITVTYNGKGRFPGNFTKSVVVRSNARNGSERVYIKGTMKAVKPVKKAYEKDSLSRVL